MCTSIKLKNSQSIILAQNYDFYYGHGAVFSNQRWISKAALSDSLTKEGYETGVHTSAVWVSKFGSITFNQFAKELPICGINEKGLAIVSMRHNVEKWTYITGENEITELQWLQMQLDLYATVDEVVAHLDSISYQVKMFPMHYHISDKTGRSIIVEYENGALVTYDDQDICACGNASIMTSQEFAKKYKNIPPEEIELKEPILDRAAKAILLSQKYNNTWESRTPLSQKAFEILGSVSLQVKFYDLFRWIGKWVPPSQTFLQVAFDTQHMKVFFKTKNNTAVREIDMWEVHFESQLPSLAYDIESSAPGNITNKLHEYTRADNERIVKKSFAPMKKEFPPEEQEELIEYPDVFKIVW